MTDTMTMTIADGLIESQFDKDKDGGIMPPVIASEELPKGEVDDHYDATPAPKGYQELTIEVDDLSGKLSPAGFDELQRMLTPLCKSGVYGNDFAVILAKAMVGMSRGIDPITAQSHLHQIGKALVPSAGLYDAMMVGSGKLKRKEWKYVDLEETIKFAGEDRKNRACQITVERHDIEGVHTVEFKLSDAVSAGLDTPYKSGAKSNWAKYPDAMLYNRAVAIMGRRVFPEKCAGLYDRDEQREMQSGDGSGGGSSLAGGSLEDATGGGGDD